MSLLNKLPSSTSCLPIEPTCILSFLVILTKKVGKIGTVSREERHTENLFLGYYKVVLHAAPEKFSNHSKGIKDFSNDLKMRFVYLFVFFFLLLISLYFENLNPNRML